MKKNHRFWLLALALSLLLTCAACGKKTVSYAPGNIPTATQEQTTDTRKNDTAETGTTKADGKQDAAKTEDKTADDKKPDKQKSADDAKKAEEDAKKQEEAKRLEEQKRLEEEKKQQRRERRRLAREAKLAAAKQEGNEDETSAPDPELKGGDEPAENGIPDDEAVDGRDNNEETESVAGTADPDADSDEEL